MSWHERRARAMGTELQVIAAAASPQLVDDAVARVDELERRWSRFLPTSELSQLNQNPGVPVIVSAETFEVICHAVGAWQDTDGCFDPTVHDVLVSNGYDRGFDQLDSRWIPAGPAAAVPTPGGIQLDRSLRAVVLPPGVRLDLGGLGKGAAADIVVDELRAAGAKGACVNLGGDVRVWGLGPDDGEWRVTLECPGAAEQRTITITAGAVCTSTRLRRRWVGSRGPMHHLIDPSTVAPVGNGIASVSVIAASAAQAEIVAKWVFVAGPSRGMEVLERLGVAGVIVLDDGTVVSTKTTELCRS